MKRTLLLLLFAVSACLSGRAAQAPAPEAGPAHVQPAFWWAGMANPRLQVLLHGEGLGRAEVGVSASEVRVERVVRPSGGNYLLLYLDTEGAAPQRFDIRLRLDGRTMRVPYELRERTRRTRRTFDASDVVYLLMPDRFANGNTKNDVVAGLRETACDPAVPDARHGGDMAGIAERLDYLADLGVTAIWPTPMLLNDMPTHSYHGYAITDYYEMDPRYGSNEEFRALVDAAHAKGIKVLMDMVFNHCGSKNFLYTDLPDSTWFNHGSRYVQTSYKIAAVSDPHASRADALDAQDGWFVESMPDWNQRNPDVLTYLVQNSIWWIEYAGIDGIRQDTYPYADMEAMAAWNRALQTEYPGFNVVGETWLNHNVGVSFWQKDSRLAAPANSLLPTVMDFPLMSLLNSALDEETNDWDRGLARIYDYLSQDAVYADPMHLLTFLDNHDTDRFARTAEQATDFGRYRRALTLLLTLRGIPQLYYGDEIGMAANKAKGDGALRQDFPGGRFAAGGADKFTPDGRTELENRYFDLTRRLLTWRRGHPAVARGTLTQFAVKDGVYVYARRAEGRTVTVVMNGASRPVDVPLARYAEVFPARSAREVLSGREVSLAADTLRLQGGEVWVLDF